MDTTTGFDPQRDLNSPGGRLAGKVAIVVGAGSSGPGWGNGKAAAALFAREGAKVLAVDVNEAAAEDTAEVIRGFGGEVEPVRADLADPAGPPAIVERALARFGGLDVLHNNVGILRTGGTLSASLEDWQTTLQVNLTGTFSMCRAAIPAMRKKDGGSIVNVASVAGIRYLGVPHVAYSVSKAGLLQLTQSTALEFAADGIRVNAILPGLMNTPMIVAPLQGAYGDADIEGMIEKRNALCPTGKMGDAWDVAFAALYLASDEARYVNAAQLVVDGGLTARCVAQ